MHVSSLPGAETERVPTKRDTRTIFTKIAIGKCHGGPTLMVRGLPMSHRGAPGGIRTHTAALLSGLASQDRYHLRPARKRQAMHPSIRLGHVSGTASRHVNRAAAVLIPLTRQRGSRSRWVMSSARVVSLVSTGCIRAVSTTAGTCIVPLRLSRCTWSRSVLLPLPLPSTVPAPPACSGPGCSPRWASGPAGEMIQREVWWSAPELAGAASAGCFQSS